MPACSRSLALGSCLALAACFNPTGQTTAASGDTGTGTTAASTSTASAGTTGDVTSAPPSTATATSQDPTTGGACGVCEAPTPYCAPTGECVPCDDLTGHGMSCGALDPDHPFCDELAKSGSGACVECLSKSDCGSVGACHPELKECVDCLGDGDCIAPSKCDERSNTCVECRQNSDCLSALAPICDAGACRGCGEHGECEGGACELDAGNCFPDARHWYVDAGQEPCQDSMCPIELPCCQIADAFNNINIAPETYHIVHVASGDYAAIFGVGVTGKRVAVLAEPEAVLTVTAPNKPLILLGDAIGVQHIDSKLFIAGLGVRGEGSVAVSCLDALYLALDDVVVHDVVGDAVFTATGCTVKARRSEFKRNTGGFHVAQGGVARLENSVVSGVIINPALRVATEGELDLLYTTIGLQGGVDGGLLACIGGNVTIRNSALLADNLADNIKCAAAVDISYTIATEADYNGEGVVSVMPNMVSSAFVDWSQSDLHLAGDGAYLKDIARWQSGDPAQDIQGGDRPGVDGTMDVAGADLPGQP